MNILFISHYADLYGANQSLLSLALYLKNKGNSIQILLPRHGPFFELCKEKDLSPLIRTFDIGFSESKNIHLFRFLKRLRALPRLLNVIRKVEPDLIYLNSLMLDLCAFSSYLSRKKYIWHIRESGELDYGVYYNFYSSFLRFLLKRSKNIITISHFLADHLTKRFKVKSTVVYNGIYHEDYLNKQLPNSFLKSPIRFGMVGLLHEAKDQLSIVKLFCTKKCNHILYLYGDGEKSYKNQIIREIKNYKRENQILLMGFEENQDTIYSNIDFLIVNSRNEGFGRITIEAFSRGIPVFAKNSGANPELLSHNMNGYLYNSYEELSEKLDNLNKINYNTLSFNCIESAKNFSLEKYTLTLEKVINKYK